MSDVRRVQDAIGRTDLVRLERLPRGLPGEVLVKREAGNPGGSVKDRIALAMITAARDRGQITESSLLVEPTSGNTGIGLAVVCAAQGLRLILTMPESMSLERRALLKAYGAELVLTPAAAGMAGAIAEARRLQQEQGAVLLDQFSNPDNARAHYASTGPELEQQTGGRLDVFLAGVGSGGTLTGTGRYLKERLPHVRLFAVEPAESPVLSGGKPGKHGIQGIGAGFVPAVYDPSLPDGILTVSTQDALETARRLFREEGLSCGISSGANVWAALHLAAQPEYAGKRIVTVAPDTGERYLSSPLFTQA